MTQLTINDFTLKGVKTFRGMEGEQYEATILCQGKPVAQVWDDGWGGCLNVDYTSPATEKLVTDFCKAQPPELMEWKHPHTGEDVYHQMDIETLANKLMDRWHDAKEAKRWEKLDRENLMFKLKGDREDGWRSIKLKLKSGEILDKATLRLQVKKKYGDKIERFYGDAA